MARHDNDKEITVIETDSGATVKWFLMGALLGAGAALLLAPQSGERTRREIANRARSLRNDAEERWDGLKDEIETRGARIKERVSEWADDVREEVEEGKVALERKANSARDELEHRLANARLRRRSAVAADGVSEDLDDMDEA